ncbi:chemotaxis protein CheB [Pseudonocardia kujensis]|uniref:chemotaxis protein CheB n=1 Tax=Pseudonocardia kujensis TaxID=1128675 RepID=UPI001E62626A|nr:chemotaxis protein CheB [Pseudonocardia kujensis]MCE0763843.1 chemotaxis protein CheB [Pseudonocardia kujensis]
MSAVGPFPDGPAGGVTVPCAGAPGKTPAHAAAVTDLVVIGASAGGVEALRALVAALPLGLRAAVVVVLHIPSDAPSALAAILGRAGPLPAVTARHGMRLEPGHIYAAPADHHVLVADGHLHLSRGPRENGHRPSIDPLFRSAAVDFGPHAIGIVLSGNRDDGTAGLAVLARHGGAALVQEPAEALYTGMPQSALDHVPGARALPAAKLGPAVAELLQDPPGDPADPDPADPDPPAPPNPADPLAAEEADVADGVPSPMPQLELGEPSPLSCPDCDGVLFLLDGAPAPRFRCRVGHAWSPASLAAEQSDGVEVVLWAALRALEEKAALQRWLADTAEEANRSLAARSHRRKADRTGAEAATLRRMLTRDLPEE